jgi:hypothetical protein
VTVRRRVDADALALIHELAVLPLSAGEVHRKVERELPGRAPDPRTVRRIVAEFRAESDDESAPWSPDSADILACIVPVIERTGGLVRWFSTEQARLLARIRRVAPDLECYSAYILARHYQSRLARGASVAKLDAWLAFAPWRGAVERDRYDRAVEAGWIERYGSPATSRCRRPSGR